MDYVTDELDELQTLVFLTAVAILEERGDPLALSIEPVTAAEIAERANIRVGTSIVSSRVSLGTDGFTSTDGGL